MSTTRTSRRLAVAVLLAVLMPATVFVAHAPIAQAQGATFGCSPGFHLVTNGQLSKFEPGSNTYSEIGPRNRQYDAVGVRLRDGYMYGTMKDQLVRIDAAGNVTQLGDIGVTGYAGDFGDDGLLHILSQGREAWYKINVDTLEVTKVDALSGNNYRVNDFANVNGKFYGMSTNGQLWMFDPANGTSVSRGGVSGLRTNATAAAAWSSAGGNLYLGQQSGDIHQIVGYTTSSPEAVLVGEGLRLAFDDSAGCYYAFSPEGIRDVDGAESESELSTAECIAAQQAWYQEYEEREGGAFEFEDAGLGQGPSCDPTVDEDRLPRKRVNPNAYSEPTVIFDSSFDSGQDWVVLSGYWQQSSGDLNQLRDCGYDYTVLLTTPQVENFRYEASLRGLGDINQGGLVFNQSSQETRSGAMIVDLANGGTVLRWGTYDNAGYYQFIGGTDVTSQGSDTIAVIQRNGRVEIEFNGEIVGETAVTNTGGYVGLVSTLSAVAFERATLTALPA